MCGDGKETFRDVDQIVNVKKYRLMYDSKTREYRPVPIPGYGRE